MKTVIVLEEWFRGAKKLCTSDAEAGAFWNALFALAFDGITPSDDDRMGQIAMMAAGRIIETSRARSKAGSVGGERSGEVRREANAKRTRSKREANAKQGSSKRELKEGEKEKERELGSDDPTLSPSLGQFDGSQQPWIVDGKVVGWSAPLTKEQVVAIATGPTMAKPIPPDYAAEWWDEMQNAGWIDSSGQRITAGRARQLLAGFYRNEKKFSPRANSQEPEQSPRPAAPGLSETRAALSDMDDGIGG